jgi:hypothetical protein
MHTISNPSSRDRRVNYRSIQLTTDRTPAFLEHITAATLAATDHWLAIAADHRRASPQTPPIAPRLRV